MKKIMSVLGSLLLMTAVKAQTVAVKKETVNPGTSQAASTPTPLKDPKAVATDPKKEAEAKAAAERAAKDAKIAQQADPKTIPAKDPKADRVDPKKEAEAKLAAERKAKDAKIAQQADPKKEAEAKAAAERAAKDVNILQRLMLFHRKIDQPQHIEVKQSQLHGRGVFAKNKIRKGELIEQAPVVFLSNHEKETLRFTKLFHYYFLLGNPKQQTAFAFGYASFYNHSPEANAFYTFSRKRNTLNIYAYQTIETGCEVTINYNGKPSDKSEVYFPNSDQ